MCSVEKKLFLKQVLCFFLLGIVVYWGLLQSQFFYIDDTVRLYSNRLIDEGLHGRVLTDVLINIFFDGIYTDASPLTQIMAIACLACAAVILHRSFFPQTTGWTASLLLAVPALLFPYYPAFLSFRFDSPFMGLAYLLCALPFAFEHASRPRFWLAATTSLLGSLLLYQVFFGVYGTIACFLLIFAVARGVGLRDVWRKLITYVVPVLLACFLYLPVYLYVKQAMLLNQQALKGTADYVYSHSSLPPLTELFRVFTDNSVRYFLNIQHHWDNGLATSLFALGMLLFVLAVGMAVCSGSNEAGGAGSGVVAPRERLVRIPLLVVLCLAAGVMPYGVQLVLTSPTWNIRTFCALSSFVTCLLLCTGALLTHRRVLRSLLVVVCGVYLIWCSLFLATISNLQRDQARHESLLWGPLLQDLDELQRTERITSVAGVGEASRTPTALKLLDKYAFIAELVPTSSLNWFIATLPSSLPVRFIYPFNMSEAEINAAEPLVSRTSYTIRRIGHNAVVVVLHPPKIAPIDIFKGGKTLDASFAR